MPVSGRHGRSTFFLRFCRIIHILPLRCNSGEMADKFAGSKFEQRSISGAGPEGVTYREVGHTNLPGANLDV